MLFGTLKLEFLDLVTWGFKFKVLMRFFFLFLVAGADGLLPFGEFAESFELYGVLIATGAVAIFVFDEDL